MKKCYKPKKYGITPPIPYILLKDRKKQSFHNTTLKSVYTGSVKVLTSTFTNF